MAKDTLTVPQEFALQRVIKVDVTLMGLVLDMGSPISSVNLSHLNDVIFTGMDGVLCVMPRQQSVLTPRDQPSCWCGAFLPSSLRTSYPVKTVRACCLSLPNQGYTDFGSSPLVNPRTTPKLRSSRSSRPRCFPTQSVVSF